MESIPEDHYEIDKRALLIEDLAWYQEKMNKSKFYAELPKDVEPIDVFEQDIFFMGCRDIARRLRQDRDWFHCNDGYEGSGKSNDSFWGNLFIDPDFYSRNLDKDTLLKDILFQVAQLNQCIKGSSRYTAITIDEGSKVLFAREAMKEKNIDLIKTFTMCRQKNLYVNICVPTIWILDPYLRNFRIKTWSHNFEEYDQRGFMKLFRKKESMWKVEPFYELRAEAVLPKFDNELWDTYLLKKEEYSVQDDKGAMYERNQIILKLCERMTQKEVGDIVGLKQQSISQIAQKWGKPDQAELLEL